MKQSSSSDKHKSFFTRYTSTNQQLEESFLELLFLSHSQSGGLGDGAEELPGAGPGGQVQGVGLEGWMEGVGLDIREQLESIQRIQLPAGENNGSCNTRYMNHNLL